MKDFTKYEGVIPAFYACYDEAGAVSPERVRALVRYLADKGVKGLYVGGSSGECIYQSVAERKLVLENVMAEAKGRLTIIAHVACNNTADSRELAAHAQQQGVDAIAAIPPIYFHLPDHGVAKYWNDISAAAPATPFIIYNIPQLAGTALTMSLFKTMLENPMVIGVKNSSMAAQDIQMFKTAAGEGHVILNGPDEQFISGRVIGADGGIGGTYGVMPELFLTMNELLQKGEIERAKDVQNAVNSVIYKMCEAHGNLYAVIKEILRINEKLDIGGVRRPLTELIPEDMPVVNEAARMIREAVSKYCVKSC